MIDFLRNGWLIDRLPLLARLNEQLLTHIMMIKELKFREIIENLIGEINEAKRKSGAIHAAGNIKSSGDE